MPLQKANRKWVTSVPDHMIVIRWKIYVLLKELGGGGGGGGGGVGTDADGFVLLEQGQQRQQEAIQRTAVKKEMMMGFY